ncbi:DUF6185 family protein [Streptomyces sp. NPDC002643]
MRRRAVAWVLGVVVCLTGVTITGAVITGVMTRGVVTREVPSRVAQDGCRAAELAGAEVRASVRLEHDDTTYTKVVSELTVEVPGTWSSARDLLLGEGSRRYGAAMACLTGADRYDPRWSDRRPRKPVVTSEGGRVRVVDETYGWVDYYRGPIDVGPWQVWHTGRGEWTVRLVPPEALSGAWWDEITVDPGRPGAESVELEPRAGEGATALVWRPGRVDQEEWTAYGVPAGLAVAVVVRPPWPRAWAAWSGDVAFVGVDSLGVLLWVVVFGGLVLAAVRRYRRRPGTPPDARRALANLRWWVLAVCGLCALAVTDGLVEAFALYTEEDLPLDILFPVVEHGCGLLCVWLLLSFARPPRSARWLVAGLGLTWAVSFLAALAVDLKPGSVPVAVRPAGPYVDLEVQLALQALGSSCLVALLLFAFVAVAWRLAADGRLLPPSRRPPGRERRLRLSIAGPTVLAVTLAMAVCFALVEERNWGQAAWLMNPAHHEYGEEHRQDLLAEAAWSVSYIVDWLLVEQGWWLTSLALIAVLRLGHNPAALTPLHDPADRLLLLGFFPLAVGLDPQNHVDNALLEFLWIFMYTGALYGVTALFAQRSVLAQLFEISRRPLATVVGPDARRRLLDKARTYREIHAELRRLDQGLFGDVPPRRDALERRLNRLHEWRVNSVPGAAPDRLPANVSVVDAVLALGPRDGWWGNGVRGARFALVPGVPAAVLNTWSQWIRGEGWQNTLADLLGFAGLVAGLVSWTVTFAGAGFVLGALWRVLPGRRGAVKALPVAVAFALPVGLDVVLARLLHESSANVALYVSTMLFVLTVTAIALDLDTFAGERRYWQSRLGLLLSIYQMRYYSLQVAYVIGQLIAIITIWQFFAEPDAVPSGGEAPPASNDGAGN